MEAPARPSVAVCGRLATADWAAAARLVKAFSRPLSFEGGVAMELMQAIYERCSVREFADKTPGTYPGCERPVSSPVRKWSQRTPPLL